MGKLQDGSTPVREKKLPKAPKGSKRLDPKAKRHVKGDRVEAVRDATGVSRFNRLNDEGTVSAWMVVPRGEG